MNSALGQAGVFILFGIISLIGTIWIYFYLKETSVGLTDKQKKELYIPQDILDAQKSQSPATQKQIDFE